ncbi:MULTISPECIES: hypothetical protein [Niallia]|uniref:RNase H type-1 domain-containing protein n=1 Tax=Niallia hominis TaxID=3133173 RepID=A0ABV1F4A1_9BACI|nr:hypothetical protein [Niallia sp. MER TA 168]MCM3362980.1 hypothetical protein [Niallia sp. MER TA 168]
MGKVNYYSIGNYKQQLMRRKKAPTKEAKERFDSWLWDSETLRVFVDGSELQGSGGIFGLGVVFVGQGLTIVKSKKHYNQAMRKRSVYAEVVAVEFALMLVEKVVGKEFDQPSKVLIYSDWNGIDRLKETDILIKRNPTINTVAEKINEKKLLFLKSYPTIELDISYMGAELKKFNPFYRASHNAARKAIGM